MWFAWLMRLASRFHEPMVAERKRALLCGLKGRVLEIGAGNGVNLQYLAQDVVWTGYEPNRWLARNIAVPEGGRLLVEPYRAQPGEYEAAICSLVLCSVEEVTEVLRGLFASLRPGGQLVFVEHVAADRGSPLRRLQDRWLPAWRCCAGGCHPNRETLRLICEAGLTIKEVEHFHLPLWLAGPHICGVATKP
ncbi:MAG: class I SAM-dependent methyltransferase [Acidobacteria bacterium]|nr:class I SAM-dependent methyltransferase [Acidobacteriota bacterium]